MAVNNPAIHTAYSFALREYRALGFHTEPNAEQYAFLLRLVAGRLRHDYPKMEPHERGAAARAGLDQALLDMATGFARATTAPPVGVPDRITGAWHGLTISLARHLPTRLAQTGRHRAALRRVAR